MNIFILDLDPQRCAEMHSDQHLGKMFLEACQLLCTAHPIPTYPNWADMPVADRLAKGLLPYNRTLSQYNHPCAKWVRQSAGNYWNLLRLAARLDIEYNFRFNVDHGSGNVLIYLLERGTLVNGIALDSFSTIPTAFCRPTLINGKYKTILPPTNHPRDDIEVVQIYRRYYAAEKQILRGKPATWTRRARPEWF